MEERIVWFLTTWYDLFMKPDFRIWLANNYGFSPRVVSNVCSRLKRAESLTNLECATDLDKFLNFTEISAAWAQVPPTSRSGIIRAVRLHQEFLSSAK